MKLNGKELSREDAVFGPLVFKRGDEFLAFYAKPVWDFEEFHDLCPRPQNTFVRFEKGGKVTDYDNPNWKTIIGEHERKRWGYLILKSLEQSLAPIGPIEFEGLSLEDPNSWGNVEAVLKRDLAFYEFNQLLKLVDEANALDSAKLEENAKSFFLQQALHSDQIGQSGEAENSESSELASASE